MSQLTHTASLRQVAGSSPPGDTVGCCLKGPCCCLSQCDLPPRNPTASIASSFFWGRAHQQLDNRTPPNMERLKRASQRSLSSGHSLVPGWHRWPGQLGWWELVLTMKTEAGGTVSQAAFCSMHASCRDLLSTQPGMDFLHSPVGQDRAVGSMAACWTTLSPITHCSSCHERCMTPAPLSP